MENNQNKGFFRLPDVLKIVPVSKSCWWAGIQSGRFPEGVRLSERTTAWRSDEIARLCELLAEGKDWRDRQHDTNSSC